MTEANAHRYLAAYRRSWIGGIPLGGDEAIKKLKSVCIGTLAIAFLMLVNSVSGLIYPSDENRVFYVYLIMVSGAVFLASGSIFTLIRLWRVCAVLGKKF